MRDEVKLRRKEKFGDNQATVTVSWLDLKKISRRMSLNARLLSSWCVQVDDDLRLEVCHIHRQ